MKRNVLPLLCALFSACLYAMPEEPYLSPGPVVVGGDGRVIYTALTTARAIAVTDITTGLTEEKITTAQNPNNLLLSADGRTLYVASGEERGTVEIISLPKKKIVGTVGTGHSPFGMALSADGKTLWVANRFSNTVSVVDTDSRRLVADISAVREPRYMAISPDGKTIAAGNFLPAQAATADTVASKVTLIDAATNTVMANVTLPNGSQSLMGVSFSGDGRWIYAVHLISRFGVPVTQIDKGWVNTNALTVIDALRGSHYATVLIDDINLGAASPAGAGVSKDGNLYIAISGCHELMRIDLAGLHGALSSGIETGDDLLTSLSFSYRFKKRIPLQGRFPLNLAFTGEAVIVSSRYSPFLEAVSFTGLSPVRITLGDEPEPDSFRRGELAFNDASICYQQWHSCASCHPDGRADGINWDQQNDGLGNPKNTKSLLLSHVTPPCMITGIRQSAEKAVRAGITHTLNTVQPESLAADIDYYLKNMPQQVSPYLVTGDRKAIKRGEVYYRQADCASCHGGQFYTDMKMYDVGTGVGADEGRLFDTPSLSELWRTAPYLYDGRASTLEEVFTRYNRDDKHGRTSHLSEEEMKDLILYIKTL
ncbi:MAG: c-type cytochrome [Dysgonamonadaceae bacterium]|jgi:YVTN family beta-propeller protein|nr:c-type cytochrome [Dysgonamonadaceae bacterium]